MNLESVIVRCFSNSRQFSVRCRSKRVCGHKEPSKADETHESNQLSGEPERKATNLAIARCARNDGERQSHFLIGRFNLLLSFVNELLHVVEKRPNGLSTIEQMFS